MCWQLHRTRLDWLSLEDSNNETTFEVTSLKTHTRKVLHDVSQLCMNYSPFWRFVSSPLTTNSSVNLLFNQISFRSLHTFCKVLISESKFLPLRTAPWPRPRSTSSNASTISPSKSSESTSKSSSSSTASRNSQIVSPVLEIDSGIHHQKKKTFLEEKLVPRVYLPRAWEIPSIVCLLIFNLLRTFQASVLTQPISDGLEKTNNTDPQSSWSSPNKIPDSSSLTYHVCYMCIVVIHDTINIYHLPYWTLLPWRSSVHQNSRLHSQHGFIGPFIFAVTQHHPIDSAIPPKHPGLCYHKKGHHSLTFFQLLFHHQCQWLQVFR